MLAHSFFIESSSKLLVTRAGIKARTSSISGLWFPRPIYMFFEMRFDRGTLDSGERSLPFGLLVSIFTLFEFPSVLFMLVSSSPSNILVQSSDRSSRIMSIFQETQNSKQSENSDNKTGVYSSFKFIKMFFRKKSHYVIFFGQKLERTLPKYAPSFSQLLIIPCIGHSRSHFLPLVLKGKKC